MRWFSNRHIAVALAVLGCLVLGGGTDCLATRMVALTPEQLAERAGCVAHGRISALETSRDPQGRIFTRIAMLHAQIWIGPGAGGVAALDWVVGGGVLGEERAETVGQAHFTVGEEVVVFLARNPAGDWGVVGLEQGRFAVVRHARAGKEEAWVRNRFWGGAPAENGVADGGARLPSRVPLSLAGLKRRVLEVKQ